MVHFTTAKHLIAFIQKNIHKPTWVFPDHITFNQIYVTFVDERRHNNMIVIRSYRGLIVDHFLVVSKLRETFMSKL